MSRPTNLLGWILFVLDLAIALLPKVKQLAIVARDEFDSSDDEKPTNLLGWLVFSIQLVVKLLPTLKESHVVLEDAFDDYEL